MKKILSLTLVAAIAMSTLAGCAQGSTASGSASSAGAFSAETSEGAKNTPVKLTYLTWDYADRGASTDAWIAGCKEKLGIEIELQNVPTDQYAATLKTKVSAKDIPDFVKMHDIGRDYGSKGEQMTVDKDMYADISDLDAIKDYLPEVVKNITRDGKIFYMPVSENALGVIYNKNIFKDHNLSVPTNYDEFIKVCNTLKAANVKPLVAPFKDAWACQIIPFIGFAQYLGKDATVKQKLYDSSTKTSILNWSDLGDGINKALDLTGKWISAGYFTDQPLGSDANVASQMIATGRAAMFITGSWQYTAVMSSAPQGTEIGFFPLPLNAANEKIQIPTSADEGVCINAKSKNLDAAKKALNYYLSPEIQTLVIKDINGIPTNNKVVSSSPFVKEISDSFKTGEVQPDWWGTNGYYAPGNITFAIDKELQNLVAGSSDSKSFLKAYDAAIQKAIKG